MLAEVAFAPEQQPLCMVCGPTPLVEAVASTLVELGPSAGSRQDRAVRTHRRVAMDETQLRLDGNAAAGILREVFVHDLSAARGACAVCGAVAQMGSQHLYMYPLSPGAVLRCQSARAF